MIHTVKGFGIVNKAEIDVFLELSCFFHDSADVGNLVSGSSAFSKTSLNIWKFMVHILLKPNWENFKHYFTSMWDEYNCAIDWAFFGIAFLWNWNEHWPFPVLCPLLMTNNYSEALWVALKSPPASAGEARDLSLIPWWGRCPGGGHGNPLQYSFLENPMDRGTWWLQSIGWQRIGHNLACTQAHTSFPSTCGPLLK